MSETETQDRDRARERWGLEKGAPIASDPYELVRQFRETFDYAYDSGRADERTKLQAQVLALQEHNQRALDVAKAGLARAEEVYELAAIVAYNQVIEVLSDHPGVAK